MKAIATFDVGTSNVKGVLVSLSGEVLHTQSKKVDTFHRGERKNLIEQQPDQWHQDFCEISQSFFNVCPPENICGLVLSGQMQDLILLDHEGKPVMDAVLYSDGRASKEAEEISQIIGNKIIQDVTANAFDGSRPLAKLKWVKRYQPEVYDKTAHVLISSKDYIITRLTGKLVSDDQLFHSGLMDIHTKEWRQDWLSKIELRKCNGRKFICAPAGRSISNLPRRKQICKAACLSQGSGDAGSATLSSGISQEGEYNINLGTSGWIAYLRQPDTGQRINPAAMPEDTYINVVPFLTQAMCISCRFFFSDIPQSQRYDCLKI